MLGTDFYACRRLWLVGYWPKRHVYLLAAQFYEGSAALLVDANGREHLVAGMPRVSPDGRFVAMTSSSDCALNGGDAVVILSGRPGFKLLHAHELPGQAASVVRWEGAEAFIVEVARCQAFFEAGLSRERMRFRSDGNGVWSSQALR